MIVTVTPNPCVDKTVFVDELKVGTFMRSQRFTCIPGGKGSNVARAVQALGRAVKAVVVVGGHSGAHVVDMIEHDDGVQAIPVWVDSPTRTITTVLEESVHRQTAFFEPGSRVTPEEAAQLQKTVSQHTQDAKVVTFNGTVSDPAISGIYRDMIAEAKARGVLTVLDSHGPEFAAGLESAPYMVKPNIAETEELVGYKLDADEARLRALNYFHERGVDLVVLSLGKDGALVSRGGECFHAAPPRITEVNPVGSGDALVAGFAIGLLEGLPLADTARLAIAAGTANAMSWDIGHFRREEVAALVPQVTLKAC